MARDLAVTLGILIDKGQRIEAGVMRLRESAARVEASRAELLRQALHLWAGAVGMPLGDHARVLLGDLLRQSSDVAVGRLVVKDALAGAAAEEVRRHWTGLLERERAVAAAQAGDGDDGEDEDDESEDAEAEVEEVERREKPEEGSPARGELSEAEIERIAKDVAAPPRARLAGARRSGFMRERAR